MNYITKQRFLLYVMILIVISGLSACDTKPEETDLLFEAIEQKESAGTGMLYEDKDSSLTVVSRSEEINSLNEWVAEETKSKLQNVDYDKHFVLVVFQGWKPSTGYSVEVNRITQSGNTVNVYAQFHEPKPDEAKADVETSPYQIVKVLKSKTQGKEITFNLLTDKTVIFSVSYVIP